MCDIAVKLCIQTKYPRRFTSMGGDSFEIGTPTHLSKDRKFYSAYKK